MKNLIFLSCLIFVISCSSHKVQDKDLIINGAPEWVYAPEKGCSKAKEICASGSGESLEEADLNAKKSLASIFESKITSNFEVQTTSFSDSQKDEMAEKVYSEVEESVDVVLKTVEIKKRYLKDNNFFALAYLDKNKAAKTLSLEIKEIDDKLNYLYDQKKRTNLKQMLILFDKRQLLHERLLVLGKNTIPSKYTFSQLSNIRSASANSIINISYGTDVNAPVQKWFEDLLNDFGYKIGKENISYNLFLDKKVSEEYLKVSGFKKFQFTLIGEASNTKGEKVGTFSINQVSNGRTKEDAYLKIKNNLLNQVEQNLYKLNME